MKHLLLLFSFFLYSFTYAQNLTGVWTGYLNQNDQAVRPTTPSNYWKANSLKKGMNIHQVKITLSYNSKKAEYTGEYYVCETLHEAHFARFSLTGTYHNNRLTYEASNKLFEVKNHSNAIFCFSAGDLQRSSDEYYEYLQGEWEGWGEENQACASGKIILRRPKSSHRLPPIAEELPPQKETTPPSSSIPHSSVLQEYKKRTQVTKESITVHKDSISIDVWDSNREDGDIISLVFNGKVLLEKHTLTKTKKHFRVALKSGQNVLTLIAHNLGTIPPNTATLEVERNEGRKKIILSSDMAKSESVLILKD